MSNTEGFGEYKEALKIEKWAKIPATSRPPFRELYRHDLHKVIDRKNGGWLTSANTELQEATDHMKFHGIWREREETFERLKAAMDFRNQMLKARMAVNNIRLASARQVDAQHPETDSALEEILKPAGQFEKKAEKEVAKRVKEMAQIDPFVANAAQITSLGPITIAAMLVYIDIEKAQHASSLWSYVGIDKAAHERYEKGQAGGGNKTLRTVLFNFASSQIKNRQSAYRYIYDRVRAKLDNSDKITYSRHAGKTGVHENAWKDAPKSHRHMTALRAVNKHFLFDWLYVARTFAGLPVSRSYAETHLGENHETSLPWERGWKKPDELL